MLNSAAGVVLPRPMLPPIREMRATRSLRSGCSRRNRAMLVSGPTGMRVTGSGEAFMVSEIRATASLSSGPKPASGISSGPSSPLLPWMSSAVWSVLFRGPEAPLPTGTSPHPMRERTRRALRVVLSTVTLPATVVTASRSRSGCPQASIMATASAWPGSTSRITGFGLTLAPLDLLQGGKLALFARHVQRDGERRGEDQVPEVAPLQGPPDRRQIKGQQEQSGETVLRSVLASRPVEVGCTPDQRGPTQVVDERHPPVSVGPHHTLGVGPLSVPLPEAEVEAGGVQDQVEADANQGREDRDGLRGILAGAGALRNPPGDDEGAVDGGVPAEENGEGHAREAVTQAVAQQLQGARGEELARGRQPGCEHEEEGRAAETAGPDRGRQVQAGAQCGAEEDQPREPGTNVFQSETSNPNVLVTSIRPPGTSFPPALTIGPLLGKVIANGE